MVITKALSSTLTICNNLEEVYIQGSLVVM